MVELPQRSATVRSTVGGVIWIGLVCWRPSSPFDVGWARQLLLFSPLVLVPMVVRLAERSGGGPLERRLARLADWLQLPAAVALVVAIEVLPQGDVVTAAIAFPWLVVTWLLGGVGLLRVWRRGRTPWPELAVDAGLVFLPIGGGWTLLHVLGEAPLYALRAGRPSCRSPALALVPQADRRRIALLRRLQICYKNLIWHQRKMLNI